MFDRMKNQPTEYPKELYGICMNDDKPQFPVLMWINKGKLYKADPKSLVLAHGDKSPAFIWEDSDKNIIIPNEKLMVRHIKANRFYKFAICLN